MLPLKPSPDDDKAEIIGILSVDFWVWWGWGRGGGGTWTHFLALTSQFPSSTSSFPSLFHVFPKPSTLVLNPPLTLFIYYIWLKNYRELSSIICFHWVGNYKFLACKYSLGRPTALANLREREIHLESGNFIASNRACDFQCMAVDLWNLQWVCWVTRAGLYLNNNSNCIVTIST